jgi:hypothetical protein
MQKCGRLEVGMSLVAVGNFPSLINPVIFEGMVQLQLGGASHIGSQTTC